MTTSDAQVPDSYTFVTNVLGLGGRSSATLAPGHELRRATSTEVSFIKETVHRLGALATITDPIWEYRWTTRGGDGLPESEWRYFVIAFQSPNRFIDDIRAAGHIARTELDCAFTAVHMRLGDQVSRGSMQHSLRLAWDLHNLTDENLFVDVTEECSGDIATLCAQIQSHDPSQIDVRQHAMALGELKGLPPLSKLRFLGRFAILESLLTHAPKPSDPYDSITRQVSNKIALLDNRWPHRLDYRRFGGADADTIWKRMYAYRSTVAHGNTPDFQKKELRLLRSPHDASALLQDAVKAVIRYALIDPQLLLDLKRC